MFEVIWTTMPFLLEGLWMTFKISIITIFSGSLLGASIGLLRTLDIRPLSAALGLYIHTLRGTPFIIHLHIVYFILPATEIPWLQLEAFPAAVIALSLYTSTYVTEIVRAAIQAVPRGQSEAARSTGMTALQSMWYAVLPQAVKLMIPPMGGVYVIIIKGTSVVSVIGIAELVRAVAADRPEAITVFCTNFQGATVVDELERELDIPIYDSVALTAWKCLSMAGVDAARVSGWGRLFGELS